MGGEKNETPVIFHGELPTIQEAEKILVEEAMKRCSGDTVAAAGILGISREDLARRLERYGAGKGSAPGKKTQAIFRFRKNAYIYVSDTVQTRGCGEFSFGPVQDEDGED